LVSLDLNRDSEICTGLINKNLSTNQIAKTPPFFSDNVPVYLFIHLKGQLMQFALRNEIQERISAKTALSKLK
jgi:hypothetical protein